MIIKTEKGTPIELLHRSSQEKVLINCDNCNVEYWLRYITYNKKKQHLCLKCRCKKNANTGKNKISKKLKKSWENGRIQYKKEKYYSLLKKMLEDENYVIITSLNGYIKGDRFVVYKCPNNHYGKVSYKQWKNNKGRCFKCKTIKKLNRITNLAKKNQ